jgi:hypothetical protein
MPKMTQIKEIVNQPPYRLDVDQRGKVSKVGPI